MDVTLPGTRADRFRPSRRIHPRVTRLLAAASSGVLLALAREPVDLGILATFALVPLLFAFRGARPRQAALLAFVAGAVYHTILIGWIWFFGAVALVPFVGGLAAYWAAVGATIAWLAGRGLRHPILTASVWVLGDALVSRFPWGGFSWAEIGYALSDWHAARAVASWGGVTLVTFLVVAISDAFVDVVIASRRPTPTPAPAPAPARPSPRRAFATVLGLVVATIVFATASGGTSPSGELRFALLQGNDINRDLTTAEIADRTLPSKHFDLASQLDGRYDLVVFPESSMDEDPRVDPALETRLAEVARRHDSAVLANATGDAPDGRALNVNLLYDPDGTLQGTYVKRHLVPFGEYVPLRSVLEPLVPAIEREIPRDFAPGSSSALFDVAGHDVATVICFETAFGPLVRGTVRDGAEVIVVSTNNRSYRRSPQAAQHVELSQMRAAETGRPVLHSSINGITAVIDHRGDVVARSELFVNSITEGEIVTTTGQTPYVRYGEWVTIASLIVVAAATVLALRRRSGLSVDSPDSTASVPSALGGEVRDEQ